MSQFYTFRYDTIDGYPDNGLTLEIEFSIPKPGELTYESIVALDDNDMPINTFVPKMLTSKDLVRLASQIVDYINRHGLDDESEESSNARFNARRDASDEPGE